MPDKGIPIGVSSLPVEKIATFNLLKTVTSLMPNVARVDRVGNVNLVPVATVIESFFTSSPDRRMLSPALISFKKRIPKSDCSVCSCITTASASIGTGAPVIMRKQVPSGHCKLLISSPAKIALAKGNVFVC